MKHQNNMFAWLVFVCSFASRAASKAHKHTVVTQSAMFVGRRDQQLSLRELLANSNRSKGRLTGPETTAHPAFISTRLAIVGAQSRIRLALALSVPKFTSNFLGFSPYRAARTMKPPDWPATVDSFNDFHSPIWWP